MLTPYSLRNYDRARIVRSVFSTKPLATFNKRKVAGPVAEQLVNALNFTFQQPDVSLLTVREKFPSLRIFPTETLAHYLNIAREDAKRDCVPR